ncbi:carbohydrate ABC transporter permease [Alicyclobacillus sp. SO9]|uniref:carbohydrate ABC transporter permease n=1 Tax=Alicyclobacillus sp. SO9 TaxID=2665646 RepID=UPI0018E72C98|nr:sugar ABC transporter permease [Alicyclobacillus sp. SO9]QQE79917.1 sugar ABC transporter permease [Alicyclobacillus sp. SO9]
MEAKMKRKDSVGLASLFGKGNATEQAMAGYLFILPAIAALSVFLIGPIFYALYISFFKFSFLDPQNAHFIGFANYVRLFHDPLFLRALLNTSIYSFGVVPIQTAISLFLALIVNKIKGKTFFRLAYYLPTVTSTVAVSVMFLFIFEPQGLLNRFLGLFGIHGPNYFNNPDFALPSIMAMAIWATVGQFMIIYLAGLQDIPDDVYEAAELDGAHGWRMLTSITVPLLRRTTFLVVVMSLIGSFQVFDQMYVISGGNGGPLNSTLSVVLDLFNQAFKNQNMGYASAMAFVLFVIILILTLVQNFALGREE